MSKFKYPVYIHGQSIFYGSLFVVSITILAVWLLGLGEHRTIFENTFLSTIALCLIFLFFITFGLYRGYRLLDTRSETSKSSHKFGSNSFPDLSGFNGLELPTMELSEAGGIFGIILAIILWIVFAYLVLMILWFVGTFLWTTILTFMAMLYWVYFRALKLIFVHSAHCRGNLLKSFLYGLGYTILYTGWFYGILLLNRHLIQL